MTSRPRPHRILLATAGSRGDVAPYLTLARALQSAGHAVRVIAPDDSAPAPDLDVVSLGTNFQRLAEQVDEAGMLRSFRDVVRPAMSAALRRVADEAMQWQPDLIVAHPKLLTVPVAAERLGIPYLWGELSPVTTPTVDFPAPGVVNRSLGGALNKLTYRATELGARMFAADVRDARQRVGLPSAPHAMPASGRLVAVSPTLLPRPADWPAGVHLTGDWPSRDVAPIPETVSAFLEAEGPIAYAGFGSMRSGDPVARAEAIVEGCRAAGLRVLLVTGWGGLEPPSPGFGPDVVVVPSVPHGAVLPRAAVAIHHGGAGTAHAAVRAGVPSVVMPFLADQPFWARQLRRLGLAGAPLHRDRVTAAAVTRTIGDAVDRADATRRAADSMRAEDGPAEAVRVIQEVADGATVLGS